MSLQEFDAIIDKMQLALDYALNLGQPIEAAKILYQMNEQLPDDLQLIFEDIDNENSVKSFISEYTPLIKSAIVEYRQKLHR
ncbi:MAG: hypothetical protein OEL69_06150 [Nitrosopumilus sp.]|jgi:hypothetical protein|nr:hypothetical protein [Nitrosopumilus sp.]